MPLQGKYASYLIIILLYAFPGFCEEVNPAKFIFSIEREASEALEKPKEIFIDVEHREIYVIDNKGKVRLQVFNLEGSFLYDLDIGTKFSLISGIGVSKSGRIYISVPAAKEVTILDFRGKFINKLDFSDIPETKELLPGKLTLDADGNLYCIDHKNQQVLVFDERDGFKFKFGSKGNDDGKFQNISDITVSHSNIFVLDAYLGRISVFDKEGKFLLKFGQKGSGVGKMSQPSGIAVDKDGNIFIADSFRHNVLVFNKDCNLWFEFGGLGTGTGWFINPSEIDIDETGRIYVVDWGNGRIQVFEIGK
ncbi:MAG: NHL repeat-containing protein [Candidatus Omnitrophica bacterium]|nr:NHL repeat-containing protein [Candidatus Omnitrophota bacterium]